MGGWGGGGLSSRRLMEWNGLLNRTRHLFFNHHIANPDHHTRKTKL